MTALVHVVAHTHWDREWYHPAGRFQLRLLRLLDSLIELLRRPDFPTFLLDGQAIALDDYLAARPERAADVGRLLRDGRLEAGPWHVLADELLVSGEALVRNLLAGGRTVRRLGGRPMAVGYAPDAFGHSGALPTILRGFGIEVAVLWRGFGGEAGEEGDLFRWRGADGAEVLMVHLPAPGYGYGASLPCEPAAAGERWRRLRALLAPRARAPHWLVLSGGDHHAAQPDLPEAVDALRALAPDFAFRHGSLEGYTDAVRLWVRGAPETLPTVIGELRGGVRHTWALQGTHGSRLYLKQENAACQRLLERYAEPLGALARARTGADLCAELQLAWRTLLENHPHDSICGTSADVVHREMMTRFARCRAQAMDLVAHALDLAVRRDAASARAAGRDAWRPGVLVFNPSASAGGGVVEAEVALVRHPVSVGRKPAREARRRRRTPPLRLRGPGGDILAHQELGARPGTDLVESPRDYPDCAAVEWRRVAVRLRDLPPLGVAALAVEAGVRTRSGSGRPEPVGDGVAVTAGGLENRHVSVRVEPRGTLAVLDRRNGEVFRGLAALEDGGDSGDSYTHSAPPSDRVVREPEDVAVRVVHGGPLRGEVEIARRYRAAALDTVTRVTLDAHASLVTLELSGVNRRDDHRLRIAFPLGAPATRVVADAHFGPVERPPARARRARARGELERPAPTAPMQRYVSVAGARRGGLTVLADGLPEYEVRRDGTVLVTVLRAFGQLSRADLSERPGHAGWPMPTPDAQCRGPFRARLGLAVHGAEALDDRSAIERLAERFHAPPLAVMVRALLDVPPPVWGPELVGDGLVFSAMKPAEDGPGVVLRCYNSRARAVRGAWRVPWPLRAADLCRLDETPLEALAVAEDGTVAFEAAPRAVVTVRVR